MRYRKPCGSTGYSYRWAQPASGADSAADTVWQRQRWEIYRRSEVLHACILLACVDVPLSL